MTGRLTPRGQAKVTKLADLQKRVQTIHAMTERLATAHTGQTQLAQALKRTYGRLKLQLSADGFDSMAQLAAGMEIASGRGGSITTKTRILREGVASLRYQIELEDRLTRRNEEAPPKGPA